MREIAIELDSPFQLIKLSCSKIALLHPASGLPYNLLPPSNSNFNVWLHGQAGQKDRQFIGAGGGSTCRFDHRVYSKGDYVQQEVQDLHRQLHWN